MKWIAALFLSASGAQALVLDGQIIEQTGTGVFELLDPSLGFTVGNDNFDSCNLFAFNEDQNIILVEPVRVDIGPASGIIAQGTEVASHYVFFDSLNGTHYGYVDFDAPILGIAAYQDTMAATDFLANTDITYIGEELRGLENNDTAWVDPTDQNRLWVYWSGSSPGDYIRVFTATSVGAAMM
jgi:hypothetical protein